eukprot:7224672-Pyramimonas_sp.AAC.1
MTEIDPEVPTHCTDQSQQCASTRSTSARRRGCYCSGVLELTSRPIAPGELYDRGISDHAPVQLRFAGHNPELDDQNQPSPKYIFESPLFEQYNGILTE